MCDSLHITLHRVLVFIDALWRHILEIVVPLCHHVIPALVGHSKVTDFHKEVATDQYISSGQISMKDPMSI